MAVVVKVLLDILEFVVSFEKLVLRLVVCWRSRERLLVGNIDWGLIDIGGILIGLVVLVLLVLLEVLVILVVLVIRGGNFDKVGFVFFFFLVRVVTSNMFRFVIKKIFFFIRIIRSFVVIFFINVIR